MSETTTNPRSSKYTSFDGWYANEQKHWSPSDEQRELRRKRRLANLTGELLSVSAQAAPHTTTKATSAPDAYPGITTPDTDTQPDTNELVNYRAETFEEARQLSNPLPDAVVEEVVRSKGNIDLYGFVEPDESDRAITKEQEEDYYYRDLKYFRTKFDRIVDGRSTFTPQLVFSQYDTPQYAKRRVAGEKIQVTDRIYLNPKQVDRLDIYQEFLEHADEQELAIRSKIYASLSGKKGGLGGLRQDTIVIYATPENRNETLALVQDIYQNHKESFEGRTSTPQTCELAPGLAVGSEPVKFTGQESLTSIRAKILDTAYESVVKAFTKKGITPNKEQLTRNVRRYAETYMQRNNIDTHNWSFDLDQ